MCGKWGKKMRVENSVATTNVVNTPTKEQSLVTKKEQLPTPTEQRADSLSHQDRIEARREQEVSEEEVIKAIEKAMISSNIITRIWNFPFMKKRKKSWLRFIVTMSLFARYRRKKSWIWSPIC
jgi:hypothetical protein